MPVNIFESSPRRAALDVVPLPAARDSREANSGSPFEQLLNPPTPVSAGECCFDSQGSTRSSRQEPDEPATEGVSGQNPPVADDHLPESTVDASDDSTATGDAAAQDPLAAQKADLPCKAARKANDQDDEEFEFCGTTLPPVTSPALLTPIGPNANYPELQQGVTALESAPPADQPVLAADAARQIASAEQLTLPAAADKKVVENQSPTLLPIEELVEPVVAEATLGELSPTALTENDIAASANNNAIPSAPEAPVVKPEKIATPSTPDSELLLRSTSVRAALAKGTNGEPITRPGAPAPAATTTANPTESEPNSAASSTGTIQKPTVSDADSNSEKESSYDQTVRNPPVAEPEGLEPTAADRERSLELTSTEPTPVEPKEIATEPLPADVRDAASQRSPESPPTSSPSSPLDLAARSQAMSRLPAQSLASKSGNSDSDNTTPVQVDTARFLHRVARAFEAAQERGGEVRLRLSPPELGALRLDVRLQEGALVARLETETMAAKTVLLENLPALRERLAEQGVRIERFEVDIMQRGPGGPPDQPQQRERFDSPPLPRANRTTAAPNAEKSAPNRSHPATSPDRLNVII